MLLFSRRWVCAAFAGVAALALASTSQAAEFSARLGSLDPTTTAKHRFLLKTAELIKQRTDGKVGITVYPSSQLGTPREEIEAVQLGSLDSIIMTASFLSGFNPAVSIFDIPYIFPTEQKARRELREGPFGKAVLETFRKRGFEPVALWWGGWKVFSSNKPLDNLKDFAGQRFRVMDSKILIRQFAALDASAIVLPFSDLYQSLQTGVIDGQENPIDIIQRMKFYEVQKNVLVDNHGAIIEVVLFSPNFWKKLPDNYRKIIHDTFREVSDSEAQTKEDDAEKSLQFLKKAGLNVRVATAAERKQLRATIYPAGRDAYIKLAGDEGKKLIDLYESQPEVAGK